MSRFRYTGVVDRIAVKELDVTQTFSDIASRVASGHTEESFKRASVRHRHMKEPAVIFGASEKNGRSEIFPGTLDKGGSVWNITNAQISHSQSSATGNNGVETGKCVIEIEAEYSAHDFEICAYEIGILYSTDNGATWTLITSTDRPLGYLHADDKPLWTAATLDYLSGAAGWWSETNASHETIRTHAALREPFAPVTTIDKYAIGIRVNNPATGYATNGSKEVHDLDRAILRITARDTT